MQTGESYYPPVVARRFNNAGAAPTFAFFLPVFFLFLLAAPLVRNISCTTSSTSAWPPVAAPDAFVRYFLSHHRWAWCRDCPSFSCQPFPVGSGFLMLGPEMLRDKCLYGHSVGGFTHGEFTATSWCRSGLANIAYENSPTYLYSRLFCHTRLLDMRLSFTTRACFALFANRFQWKKKVAQRLRYNR